MPLETVALQAEPRSVFRKRVKLLRRQGIVPANLYGRKASSKPIQISERQVELRVARSSRATLYSLDLPGEDSVTALVKEVQRHPTSGKFLHIDFFRVAMTEKLRVSVPLHFVGESYAVVKLDGTLLHNLSSVEVECLPADMPSSITVDVTPLDSFEAAIHVGDLQVPEGVEVLSSPDELVSTVVAPRIEVAEVEEEEEAAEGVAKAAEEAAPTAEEQEPAAEDGQEQSRDS